MPVTTAPSVVRGYRNNGTGNVNIDVRDTVVTTTSNRVSWFNIKHIRLSYNSPCIDKPMQGLIQFSSKESRRHPNEQSHDQMKRGRDQAH